MPDMGGLELRKHIRCDFPDCYCHLILLTSNSEKEQVVEGLQVDIPFSTLSSTASFCTEIRIATRCFPSPRCEIAM
jgi:DNA-binding NarL/FixJ family response regulator